MGTLNQEVSELTKGLHHMLHLLQAHVSLQHYSTSHSSYSYSVAPNTGIPFNVTPTYHLHSDPGSHDGHRSVPAAGRWSFSGASETQTETQHRPQSSSPPAPSSQGLSVNSALRLGPCRGSESTNLWTGQPLLSVSSGFPSGIPGLTPHRDSENRPLSASPSSISQSQPTLCLQPPSDTNELSCLLSSAPTGASTQSLLDSSPTSYPNLCVPSKSHLNLSQPPHEDICALMSAPATRNPIQDTSIFQIEASNPSIHALSVSPSTSPGHPLRSPLNAGSPLGDPSAVEHTSLECLLGNGGSTESRDSESASSRRSSIGVQTQSSEQSWCLDLTD